MMADFSQHVIQEQCPENCTTPKQQKAWLEQQSWYIESKKKGTLYSDLFELFERKERGRQFYIEQMIEGKKPSFGYVVLANLMARNYINTVLTTNFDDLIYNACTTFTDMRPVVYAYGTMISDLRVTSARPKILKLHGDYLYSKLKNSENELAHQDPNMSRYVSILVNEYGLVVVGYSGCDNSVMEMLRKFPPNNDFYWCGRKGSEMPECVRSLLVETDGCYIEIESFDHMMNEIRSVVGFDVPKMLGSLEARQDQMIEQLKTFPRSLDGLGSLLQEIYNFRRDDAAASQQKSQKDRALLHYVTGFQAWQNSDFQHAEAEFRASVKLNPDDFNVRIILAGVLCQKGKYTESQEELEKLRANATGENLFNVTFQFGYLHMVQGHSAEALKAYSEAIRMAPQNAAANNGLGVSYLYMGRLNEAAAALHKAVELDPATYYAAFNLASVLTIKGDQPAAQEWWAKADSLWQDHDHIDAYNHATIQACRGHADKAVEEMKQAIQRGQPGLASLALQSVLAIERAPNAPAGISELRKLLEQAATRDVTRVDQPAG